MTDVQTIELDSLIGEHVLDGVDTCTERVKTYGDDFEDAQVIRFRLDGKVYTAIENPEDGYRSCMDRIFVEDCAITNVFPPINVIVRKTESTSTCANESIQLLDAVTGKVVVEVGTSNTNDYYPYFTAEFNPQNMVTNQ